MVGLSSLKVYNSIITTEENNKLELYIFPYSKKGLLVMNLEEWQQLCRKALVNIMNIYKKTGLLKYERVGILFEYIRKLLIQNASTRQNPINSYFLI